MKNLCDLHTGHEQTLGDLWVKKETLDGWPWLLTKMCTGTPPLREPIWIGDHRSIYIHPGFTTVVGGYLVSLYYIKVQGYSGWLMANKIQFPLTCTTTRRWFQTSRFVWPLWWCRGRSCLTGLLVDEKHVCKWNPKHVMSMNHDCWTPHTPKSKFPSPHSLRLLQPTRWCEESESKSKSLCVPHMRRMGKGADSK